MKTSKKHILCVCRMLVCFVLITAVTLTNIACGKQKSSGNNSVSEKNGTSVSDNQTAEGNEEKKVSFKFSVVDGAGKETFFDITTSKKTVGEALLDEKLIEGEPGAYGLYVKKVNGIVADFDKDGTYWAFYVDGAYAMSGVDTTDVEAGKTYTFKVEK